MLARRVNVRFHDAFLYGALPAHHPHVQEGLGVFSVP